MCDARDLGGSELDSVDAERAELDFKESFDPGSLRDWCELIKDIVAMANSGGGTILVGVADDGRVRRGGADAMLEVDPADFTNKIHSYTGQHFAAFSLAFGLRRGERVGVLHVRGSRIPIVFTAPGSYPVGPGQKSAFARGAVYFRHGAKSEPGTSEDLRLALERELETVKRFWLDGIGKVVGAAPGSRVVVIADGISDSDGARPTPGPPAAGGDSPAQAPGSVALLAGPGAAAIRLTKDEAAPALSVVQADSLYPYRETELKARLAERLGGRVVSSHDLQCVRRTHPVDEDPTYSHRAQFSPRKYSEAYLEWLCGQVLADPEFFRKARDAARAGQG